MIEISHLSFSFGPKKVFSDINMMIEQGKVNGIVGRNGVGKTTLFRILTRVYKMQQGTILLSGQRLRSSDIAFMPTEPYFYPYMKGKEYLDIVASTPQERQKSEKYCHYLELPLNELVDNYSTGMRKKLAFSAHFSLNKPVIILDEPYNGVDLEGNEVIKHIIKSNSETKTILLSSHILSTITDISHCIYHLNGPSDITAYSNENFGQLEQSLLDHMHHKMQF